MFKHYYLLKWLIPNSVLIFVAIGSWHFGFLLKLYSNDTSYISTLITIIYLIASLFCLYKLYFISNQINIINEVKKKYELNPNSKIYIENEFVYIDSEFKIDRNSQLQSYLKNLILKSSNENNINNQTLLELFADKLSRESKVGSFIADSLFKLGLLGTIIGFVLMLQPIASLDSFDEISIKNALTSMSAGMSIALFTTLTGLIGGLLLKVQYFFLENAAENLFYITSEVSEIFLIKNLTK